MAAKESAWRNEKHRAQWRVTLSTYAKPLYPRPVDEIDTQAVLAVLTPLWQRAPETASRLRGRIEAVLDAAKAQGHRSGENPAAWRGHLAHLLPKRGKLDRGHHAALAYTDIAALVAKLRQQDTIPALALEFIILTAARSGEVLGAKWDEIDIVGKVWIIPAARMKAAREIAFRFPPPRSPLSKNCPGFGRTNLSFRASAPRAHYRGPGCFATCANSASRRRLFTAFARLSATGPETKHILPAKSPRPRSRIVSAAPSSRHIGEATRSKNAGRS